MRRRIEDTWERLHILQQHRQRLHREGDSWSPLGSVRPSWLGDLEPVFSGTGALSYARKPVDQQVWLTLGVLIIQSNGNRCCGMPVMGSGDMGDRPGGTTNEHGLAEYMYTPQYGIYQCSIQAGP
ncbi:hypothetical protein NDU88_003559 [Pleurodeles waltl]|uniref:Uncharacterized protein n=1 Tax=Pleurodeles waltl TaxID=8319 RepID=A0AAV7RIW8_PLEWA|nr:hypothetical protein NDU88_003559 [Pleurodeles waltl]